MEGPLEDNLILAFLSDYGLPRKILSDECDNFTQETLRNSAKILNMEQAVSWSCHHQITGQVETSIRLIRRMFKKCINTNVNQHIVLWQVRLTPSVQGFPSFAMLLLNCPI